jgi:hypothetical protein
MTAPSRLSGSLVFFVLSCGMAAGQATSVGEEGIPLHRCTSDRQMRQMSRPQ